MKIALSNHLPLIIVSWILITRNCESSLSPRSTYIVHMDKSSMPKEFERHEDWYLKTVISLNGSRIGKNNTVSSMARVLYTYHNALHGFSAVLSGEELNVLKSSIGFISAYPDKIVHLDTTHTFQFLSLNNKSGLWPASSFGEGVIVGMIDTGVWPESKSYNDAGMTEVPKTWKGICEDAEDFSFSMCNRKLIGARNFNKGAKAANLDGVLHSNSPRDREGHGTHTSATVAGNYVEDVSHFGYAKGTARGIAPRARLAMYKASKSESDLLAAMDIAIADGVDIISISMGYDQTPLYEDSIAIASFAAMERGIMVSSSAGNSGPFEETLHNGTPWMLTVGAGTSDRQISAILTLGDGHSISGWSRFPANALLMDVPLFYDETLAYCNSSQLLSKAEGKIVICSDMFENLMTQIFQVRDSTVAGAVFISSRTPNSLPCPGVVVKPVHAQHVINYAKSAIHPTATLKFQQDVLGVRPAPVVASYSSRGPSHSYPSILKPDLVAPGSEIVAAFIPTEPAAKIGFNLRLSSEYKLMTGTSMSCPHASGVAALLKGAHPEWSPAAIRSAMMTSARQFGNDHSPIRDDGLNMTYATPLAMGAGHVDPNRALDPGLIYDLHPQDYVSHLCRMNFTEKQILAITRSSKYKCSNTSDLNYPSFMAFFSNTSSTTCAFQRKVTNVGNSVATYKANLEVPQGTSVNVRPDTLVFTEKNQKLSFNVYVDIKAMESEKAHGSLVWNEVGGHHAVRSPIMVIRRIREMA